MEKTAETRKRFPLTPFARGMYIENRLHPDSPEYDLLNFFEIKDIPAERVREAFERFFRTHEVFRTVYRNEQGVIFGEVTEDLPEITIVHTNDIAAGYKAAEQSGEPFDLARIPARVVIYTDGKDCLAARYCHHICFDGTSEGVFLKELFSALGGSDPEICRYDIAEASAEDRTAEYDRGFELYKELFADGVPESGLPLNAPLPDAHPLSDSVYSFTIGGEGFSGIKTAAKEKHTTAFCILLAAFSITVAKYAASKDIVVTVPTNARSQQSAGTVGMFVNPVPLRLRPVRGKSTGEYIAEVSAAVKKFAKGNICPFDRLAAAFTDKDNAGALSRTGVNYLHMNDTVTDGKITIKCSYRLQPSAKDINLVVHAKDDRFVLHLQYSSGLFGADLIQRFAGQLALTAEKLCGRDSLTLSEAMVLPEAQKTQLDGLSFTAKAEVPVKLLHKMFERSADSLPGKTALIACDGTFTYDELERRANRTANALAGMGFGRGGRAVILLRRTSAFFAALFGVLKAGGTLIPTDPGYPAERVRCTIEDCGADIVITDGPSDLPGSVTIESLLACTNETRPEAGVSPDDLAYMIYTSGSTGKPKGVMLRHIGICNYLTPHQANLPMLFARDSDAVYLSVTTVAFDMSFKEHCAALCNGKTLVFASDSEMNDPKALAGLIRKYQVTCMNATSSRMQQYLNVRDFAQAVAGCRYLLCGGEPYPMSLRDKLRSLSDSAVLINTYGPTEITVSSNAALIGEADHIHVGRPLLNYVEYIADRFGAPAPLGAAGELYIGGPGTAAGYNGMPERTAESFVEFEGMRMYRSGDLAKWDSAGNIMILGRLDKQVKLRGLRIEPGEIENVICSFPHITEAAADVRKIGSAEHLAAYYTADSDIDEGALAQFCASRLTHYMVPDAFVRIDQMPHSANGKRSLKSLPDPVLKGSSTAAERALTRLERGLCELAEKAFGSPVSDVSADLMRLGMNSLSAISFAAFAEDKYGVELPVGRLMRGASITDVEDMIVESLLEGGTHPAVSDTDDTAESEKRGAYPLSSNQLGVYYDAMKKPGETLYNMPVCLRFESVDTDRLRAAVEKAVACHSCMNTRITFRGGELIQIPDREHRPDIPVTEMTETGLAEYRNEFVRPFDLHSDYLYRFEIVRTEKAVYLLSDIHHIIFDGLSRGIFMETVSKAYAGEEVSPEKTDQYGYAIADAEYRDSDECRRSEGYFAEILKDLGTASMIPEDKSGRLSDGRLAVSSVTMDKKAVTDFCRENGITPSALFLAAVSYTVSRFTGSRDVYISTISGGRSDPRFRGVVGMLVNTIPLHIRAESSMTVRELLAASADSMLAGIENEKYPFMNIAEKFGYVTEIMYECQLGVTSESESVGGAEYTAEYLKNEAPKFRTAIAIEEKNGKIAVSVRYNDAVYTAEYMDTLAECVKVCAVRMISGVSAEVGSISLLTEEEKRLVASFETSQLEKTPVQLLHRLFEEQAERVPEKTALIACDRTLTYSQLDRAANIAANKLITRGVSPRGRVVLLLPRRSFYFIALLAVLKAGAAFIPCDPEYPAQRIAHITGDSGASAIITTEEHLAGCSDSNVISIEELLGEGNAEAPTADITPDDLAYLIYTSGSTGKPKGVMLRHAGICNFVFPHSGNILIKNTQQRCGVYVSVTTVSFDMSLKENIMTLCSGNTIVFANEEECTDPRALTKLIMDTGADVMNCTPSRLNQYLGYKPFAEALAQFKTIACGGEPYPIALRDRLRELTGAVLLNTYGPTEITVSSNVADLTNARYISVGRPLPNCHEYIVDTDGNLLPHGVTGELYIGGSGVAAGYNGLEKQTAERFTERDGIRIYKSGDLAKWDRDGNVMILGRSDGQLKLRGLRIEPGEISGLIEKQPHIRKAAVLVRKVNGTDNLCAYYTADCPIDAAELKKTLSASLTAYMVPAAYMQLEAFPVTPNGKTDLRALPDPLTVLSGGYEPPANGTEEYFCGLFAKVLGLEKVGAADSFFELGGTSLLVMSVTVEAAENGYEITYGDVFRRPSPRELAQMFSSGVTDESVRLVDFSKYDYSAINGLLSRNTMQSLCAGKTRPVGNILLTGATGFMGAHVLHRFLTAETGRAYCLMRKGRFSSAFKRLKNIMFYYFGEDIAEVFTDRVEVFDGNVTNAEDFVQLEKLPIDTVFNCAANVKHFSNGTDIEDVNVGGARNCISFCLKTGARLIHFSTVSVAGASAEGVPPVTSVLDEQTLYIGQRLDTKYSNSKLLAERDVLEAAAVRGLDAKVIRVGTLSARESDGEVQINFLTNNFMGRLRSYVILGVFPYSMMNSPVCLGPIDESAEAFFALAETPKECCLFNCTNSHSIPLSDIIIELRRSGMQIEFVTDGQFENVLREAQKDPRKAAILSSMLAYRNMAHGKELTPIRPVNSYTTQALAKRGFFWRPTGGKYLTGYINALSTLNFFDTTELNR